MNAVERLNSIIHSNKIFKYHDETIQIVSFNEWRGNFVLKVIRKGKETIMQKSDEKKLNNFLDLLKEVADIQPVPKQQEPELIEANEIPAVTEKPTTPAKVERNVKIMSKDMLDRNASTFENLTAILVDDINKVRQDPKYVPQAKQVANSAQTIINMVKLQLDIITKG